MSTVIQTCKMSFSRFKYKLYLAVIFRSLLPTIYRTFRFSLLGALPSTSAVSIASQMTWIGVILEVVDEGLLLPLYHCIGSSFSQPEKAESEMKNRVKTGFLICTFVYVVFEGSVAIAAPSLVQMMGQQTDLLDETVAYIRIELVAFVFVSLSKFFILVVVLNDWPIGLYIALAIQMSVSIIMDVFLLSQLSVSLNLGVTGAAWSSVASSVTTFVFLFIFSWCKLKMDFHSDICEAYDFKWIKVWSKVGFFSALDSLIRNVVYLIVVLRAMNLLNEQDSYWIANGFIWDWLLLPVLPLAEVIKQDVATSSTDSGLTKHWAKVTAYLIIALNIVIIWAATIPAWPKFLTSVLQAHNPDQVISLLKHLVPCYTFFVLTSLTSGVFYGLGRTDILVATSFIVNLALVAFFLMTTYGIIPVSVEVIASIFGGGLVFGAILNMLAYLFIIRRKGCIL